MKTLNGITVVEKAFYEMAKLENNLQEYFFLYYAQKVILFNHVYSHIPEELKGYTDHGSEHITRILKIYGKMLKNNIPNLTPNEIIKKYSLNFYEMYILLCATIWHDVGNIYKRYKHNEKVIDVCEKISDKLKKNYFIDDELQEYVLQIAVAHSGEDGINRSIKKEKVKYKNEHINLKMLGAILRIADEMEEGQERVDSEYYKMIQDDPLKIRPNQRIYWETSFRIKMIEPMPDNNLININISLLKKDISLKFLKKKVNVALIDELIYRVNKINEERKYYMKFENKLIEFQEVKLELEISGMQPITFTFNDSQGYKEFWLAHKKISPVKIIRGYRLQN